MDLNEQDAGALFRAVFESAPDGVLVVDHTGSVKACNRALAAMFGATIEHIVGSSIENLVPEDSRDRHVRYREAYSTDPSRRPMGTGLDLVARHADGGTFPVEVSLSPLDVSGENLTIAAVRDVTERQAARSSLALAEERERIARDIHDMVIQRVFAAGMSLQAVMAMVDSPVVRERLSTVTDDLDDTIRELRAAIFGLGNLDVDRSLATQVRATIDERSRVLGFTPELVVEGSLDDVPDYVAEQLLATVTESLSNVARHAGATTAHIEIRRLDDELQLTVSDDGQGITGTPKTRGGLSNMMWRAAELGGTCAVAANEPNGTRLTWRVPV
ncbi:MAG: PAS domain-containing sensor histidine kinase [Actinomycetota bacterium]